MCTHTVWAGASQTNVSSCLPSSHALCTRPTVPASSLTPGAFITGTRSWAGGRRRPSEVCVCVGGQSPVKSGCLTKVESIYLLLLFQGKSLQSPHWGIIFNPLRGHLCSFHLSVMKSSGISYSTSLLGRCRVPQQCPGSVDHSPLGKTLPLKLLTVIPGDQNWPRMKGLIPQGK